MALLAIAGATLVLAAPAEAAYPGANGKIAFTSGRDFPGGFDYEVMTVNPDGSGLAQLTSNATPLASSAWSPDGEKLAFTGDPGPTLYTIRADGSGLTRLTDISAAVATWSPDGSQIAFVGDPDRSGYADLYVINADGSGLRLLHDFGTSWPGLPQWSPNNDKIAFMILSEECDLEGCNIPPSDIYTISPAGDSLTNLTNTPGIHEQGPNWSPDGKMIAFSGVSDIEVMNADGSGRRTVTPDGGVGDGAIWSPDGTKMAFLISRDGHQEIYTMDADGTNVTRITDSPYGTTNSQYDWQPLPFKNRAKQCKAEGKRGRDFGACVGER